MVWLSLIRDVIRQTNTAVAAARSSTATYVVTAALLVATFACALASSSQSDLMDDIESPQNGDAPRGHYRRGERTTFGNTPKREMAKFIVGAYRPPRLRFASRAPIS